MPRTPGILTKWIADNINSGETVKGNIAQLSAKDNQDFNALGEPAKYARVHMVLKKAGFLNVRPKASKGTRKPYRGRNDKEIVVDENGELIVEKNVKIDANNPKVKEFLTNAKKILKDLDGITNILTDLRQEVLLSAECYNLGIGAYTKWENLIKELEYANP